MLLCSCPGFLQFWHQCALFTILQMACCKSLCCLLAVLLACLQLCLRRYKKCESTTRCSFKKVDAYSEYCEFHCRSMSILKSSSMYPAGCNLNRIAADFIVCSLLLYSGSFKPFTVTGACFPTLTELHSGTLASNYSKKLFGNQPKLCTSALDIKHLWFVKGWNYQFMYFISERNKHSLNLEAWLHCYIVTLFSVSGPTLQTS